MITFKAKTNTGEIIKSSLSRFVFPAGEAHIKQEERRELEPVEIAIIQSSSQTLHNDLFALAMWSNYLVHAGKGTKQVVVLPYFPGARADRGNPFGAEVYTDYIYNLMVHQVIIYDPHSAVVVDLLNHDPALKVTTVYPHDILNKDDAHVLGIDLYDGVIAPDKGAKERAGAVARELGVPLYTATKTRNFDTGKLSGFGMEQTIPADGIYLIVDDICDGGGTFVGLSDHLQENYENIRLDLYVSHGVFSGQALYKLDKAFSKVITTNSYDPWRALTPGDPGHFDDATHTFHRIDVIRPLLDRIEY